MLFAVPLLAMRLIAEERRNQTMVLLVSAPVTMTEIVLGKFAGLTAFLLLILGITTLMPLSLLLGGRLDFGLLLSLIAGVALLAMSFSAISLLRLVPDRASAGGGDDRVRAAARPGCWLAKRTADGCAGAAGRWPAALAQVLSPLKNFEPFAKGVIDSYAIACSLLLIAAFLVLAIRRLDAARLRG
jgi:ABC-2 type transport system permease protein